MRVEVNTKYDVGDVVFGYYNNNFFKFKITNIQTHTEYEMQRTEVIYSCTAIIEDSECTFRHEFNEYELYSNIDEIIEKLKKL
jgi:ribosome-associated translation inhibitor RaiA